MFMLRPMMLGAGLLSALRPQDVFAPVLVTGTGNAQQFSGGFAPDFAWLKSRGNALSHQLAGRTRPGVHLRSNTTDAEVSSSIAFNATGISAIASSGDPTIAWLFKYARNFCVEVPYTGDGTSGRVIPHGLGIKPGMIIIKRRDADGFGWITYHASLGANLYLQLGTTGAQASSSAFYPAEPTSTGFTVGNGAAVNGSGGTYVAYLFAHDPDTTNGIVQCGVYTQSSGGNVSVNIGWQPQFLILKDPDAAGGWFMVDATRGFTVGTQKYLIANTSEAESSATVTNGSGFTTSGFNDNGFFATPNSRRIFMAIRAPIT